MSTLESEDVGTKILGYSIVGLGIAILFGALVILGYLVSGLVLSIVWDWFIVTTFGVSSISIVEAIGISIVVGLFTKGLATHLDVDDDDRLSRKFAKSMVRTFVSPFITLGIAWVVYQFM